MFRVLRKAPLAGALLWCAAAFGQEVVELPVPWYSLPGEIAEGPDGAMWFTDWVGIGRVDRNGEMTPFSVGSEITPLGITTGPDGNLWFTGGPVQSPGRSMICRITMSGALTSFPLPDGSDARAIVSGPDGNLWFTELDANRIGRMTTSGTVAEFALPTASAELSGLAAGLDGNVWFTEYRTGKIGRITPDGGVTEFALSGPNPNPGSITAGPDGNLWFTENAFRRIGRITPAGEITEFPMAAASHKVAAGKDGHLWVLGADGRVRRVSTSGSVTELSTVPPPLPNGLAVGQDGSLWMTSGDGWDYGGVLYRFALDVGDCIADGTTLCLNGGRFRVTTEWKAPNGAHGSGHASALTADSGYFWFFDPASVEVVVKVLNGCSGSRNYWVFGAGLTNVEVTTKVTDSETGFTKQYTNPQGTPFAPIQDTAAFAACE